MKSILSLSVICLLLLTGCASRSTVTSPGAMDDQQFKGKIARSYADSQEWWPEPVRPHLDAPNILILLLDDVGFAQHGLCQILEFH